MHECFLALLKVLMNAIRQSIEVRLNRGCREIGQTDLLVLDMGTEVLHGTFGRDVDYAANALVQDRLPRFVAREVQVLDDLGNAQHGRRLSCTAGKLTWIGT